MRQTLGSAATGAWSGGVVKSADPTNLPINTSPRGLNSALALERTGVPFVQKRKGLATVTASPLTPSTALIGQYDYVEVSTGTRRHLCSNSTVLAVKAVDGTYTSIYTGITSSTPPDFATAKSMAFFVNGTDAFKVRGTTIENIGIAAPTVGTMAGAAGAAGLHNGTYELRVAFQNTTTGHISSASETASATVTVTDQEIDWSNVPVSADSQVGRRILLVRNTATMAQFYQAGTIEDNSTTTASTSVLDENLVIAGPTLTSRDQPLSGMAYAAVFKGRLVLASSTAIYWSPIDEPESFPPQNTDTIDTSGDPIKGLHVHGDQLLILKDDRTFVLTGELGGAYTLTQVDANVGCVSHRTIVSAGGYTFWWSRQGIVRFNGEAVERVGMILYGDPSDRVAIGAIDQASAVTHDVRGVIYFALPGIGQDRATFILPYNYIINVLESESWDPMDAASLGLAVDGDGVLQPMLGGYAGQVFQMWIGHNDGVPSTSTLSGSFTTTSSNESSLTDGSAAFITTGGGLVERRLTIYDAAGDPLSIRPRITANTATTLSFTPAVAVDDATAYTYEVGGPYFEFDTPWDTMGQTWIKKRFEYLFALLKGLDYGTAATFTISFDYDDVNLNGKDRTFTSAATGATFDTALFDTDVFDAATNVVRPYRVARTGRAYRVRVSNTNANSPLALLQLGIQAVGQTTKR